MNKLILLLLPMFIACSNSAPSIEVDKKSQILTVSSEDYKISNILINEVVDGKAMDSTYVSVDFDVPQKVVDLKNLVGIKSYGATMSDMLAKNEIVYKVALKKDNESKKSDYSLVVFNSKEIVKDKEIFTAP